MTMNLSYHQKILNIEKQIQQLYAPIRDLKELRNSYTSINRLPPELLSRIFNEIRLLNYEDSSAHELLWHRNIVHICRHWRNVGCDTPSLWNRISPPHGVERDALTHYISRVRRNQCVEIISNDANWELVLSYFEGSDSHVTSLTTVGEVSFDNLLKVSGHFHSLSSVVSFSVNAAEIRYQDDRSLPLGLPFFSPAVQLQLQNIHLERSLCIPWKSLKPHFTGLHTLVACVPFTRLDECIAFLGVLQHMNSLQKLHINQLAAEPQGGTLQWLYEETASQSHRLRPSPRDIILRNYGEFELRILLMSLSLDKIQCIRLDDITQPTNGLPPLYETLRYSIPSNFFEAMQYVSLQEPDTDFFDLRGFRKKILSADAQRSSSCDLAFELRGHSCSSLEPDRYLPRVIRAAQLLAPNATSLHLVEPGRDRCRDGSSTLPGMEILQAFPDIRTLVIDDENAGARVLPALGLSCLWKNGRDEKWHTTISKWNWSGLKGVELGVGCVKWCYDNPYPRQHHLEISEFESSGGIEEHWYPKGYRFVSKQVFEGVDRDELLKMVSSLVPKLEVLELPQYQLSSDPDLEFLVTSIWFRNAVGLPIPRVVLPHQKGEKWQRFVALKKIVAGTTMVTMNEEWKGDGKRNK